MSKLALPYPILLLLAALGLFILQAQVDPALLHLHPGQTSEFLTSRWNLMLSAIVLGLIAVRLGGPTLWPVPSIYVFLFLIASFFHANRIALHLLEYGALAVLVLLAALLAMEENVSLLLALFLVRNFTIWHYQMIFPIVPHHAVLFLGTANFTLFAAILQSLGLGFGLIFNWWPIRSIRLAGAAMITAGLLNYFYRDLHNFANFMLY